MVFLEIDRSLLDICMVILKYRYMQEITIWHLIYMQCKSKYSRLHNVLNNAAKLPSKLFYKENILICWLLLTDDGAAAVTEVLH